MNILLLGDPRLRVRSVEVHDPGDPQFIRTRDELAATLAEFRARHGFGRAISAPQIGAAVRCIAVTLNHGLFFVINPVVTWKDPRTFTMWDDCMSFPDLLVRVERHDSISLSYVDESGAGRTWDRLPRAAAELMQHEIDHLDGILAVDRAIDGKSLVLRTVFEERSAEMRARVDYNIGDE